MARDLLEPSVAQKQWTNGQDCSEEKHPAYAVIQVSRVSGYSGLFDSDFKHHSYINVRIKPAYVHRSLSSDTIMDESRTYIEVAMSEAQWATAITSLNSGCGTPCTLSELDGKVIPGIAKQQFNKDSIFKNELQKALSEADKRIDELEQMVGEMKGSQKQRASFTSQVQQIRQSLKSNITFISNQFTEHMERTKECAKAEVNAHYSQLQTQLKSAITDKSELRKALSQDHTDKEL